MHKIQPVRFEEGWDLRCTELVAQETVESKVTSQAVCVCVMTPTCW